MLSAPGSLLHAPSSILPVRHLDGFAVANNAALRRHSAFLISNFEFLISESSPQFDDKRKKERIHPRRHRRD
jgi:hypothetical protein